jgi:hypothetical protein
VPQFAPSIVEIKSIVDFSFLRPTGWSVIAGELSATREVILPFGFAIV